jgi:hypothetical protein
MMFQLGPVHLGNVLLKRSVRTTANSDVRTKIFIKETVGAYERYFGQIVDVLVRIQLIKVDETRIKEKFQRCHHHLLSTNRTERLNP